MVKITSVSVCALTMCVTVQGCNNEGNGQKPAPEPTTDSSPRAITRVASGGFDSPADAVVSHDGKAFYFSAWQPKEEESVAAILRVDASGGAPEALHKGDPLGNPSGLVLGCDSGTLYVADMGRDVGDEDEATETPSDGGGLFALSTASGELTELEASGIGQPTGLALSDDCTTLYITGWTTGGEPALFTLPIAGGTARTVLEGEPLVSPTGLHVDKDQVAWVMDHLAVGKDGVGVLFAISDAGEATEVVSDLDMGTPGGVSLDSTGQTAFMPTLDDEGMGQLTSVRLSDGELVNIATPMIRDPAGIRTARNTPIFVVVDRESGAIFSAQ